jgi:hyperosmotically inducible periplasmic protein
MRVRHWIAALALAAVAAAPSAALAQTPKVDDSELKSRIEKKIAESPSLKKDDITVAVDNAVVTLTGKVHTQAHRTTAASLAKVTGVTRVDNKLEVETAATSGKSTTEKAKDKTETAADKTAGAAKKAGKATKDAAGEVGEAVTDAWITTTIKTDMVDEDALKGSDINVDTNEHVVTLKGTVASAAGRTRAVAIAKGTKGVKKVIDNLTIAPKK